MNSEWIYNLQPRVFLVALPAQGRRAGVFLALVLPSLAPSSTETCCHVATDFLFVIPATKQPKMKRQYIVLMVTRTSVNNISQRQRSLFPHLLLFDTLLSGSFDSLLLLLPRSVFCVLRALAKEWKFQGYSTVCSNQKSGQVIYHCFSRLLCIEETNRIARHFVV